MDGEALYLGTEVAAWQVKDFSVVLRQAITAAARRQNVTVSEFLHAHFTRYGLDGVDVVSQPQQTLPDQTLAAIEQVCKLTEAAARFAEQRGQMPPTLAGALTAALRISVRLVRPPSPPKRLAAPKRGTRERDAARAETIHDVLAAIREVYGKASDPTPLHKGIRIACSSISDRVEALADSPEHRSLVDESGTRAESHVDSKAESGIESGATP